jgi:trk system potassium uptake protein TrkA
VKIIILGAGQVGSTLAEHLVAEGNDVTVVDRDPHVLAGLHARTDVRTVAGHAAYPVTLRHAGAQDADMLIAVTDSDETNMLACRIAATLFRTPTKIARVRSADYLADEDRLFQADALAIDLRISPEELVTTTIRGLIEHQGALQVVDFAGGRARLVGVCADYGGPLVGRPLIETDDEVFFIAASHHVPAVMALLRRADRPAKRIMIAGGGNIGLRLARAIQGRLQVKLIERSRERAKLLAEQLDHTIVLGGDAANEALLVEENIEDVDVFCSVTNDDEANVLSAMLAKRLGARRAMALINRMAYVDLVEGGPIDIAISPQQATISALLSRVRRGDVAKVHTLRRGAAEAIEAVAHGDAITSQVIARRLDEIKLPPGTSVSAVIRGERVLIAHGALVVEPEDHLILFLVDKRRVREVERLFQVTLNFV